MYILYSISINLHMEMTYGVVTSDGGVLYGLDTWCSFNFIKNERNEKKVAIQALGCCHGYFSYLLNL